MAKEEKVEKKPEEIALTQIATQVETGIQLPDGTVATKENLLPAILLILEDLQKLKKSLL